MKNLLFVFGSLFLCVSSSWAGPEAAPRIHSFSPVAGIAGTRVFIRGEGFAPGVNVSIGDKEAKLVSTTENVLVIEIPTDASTGKIRVTRKDLSVRSSELFSITSPAPRISKIEPTSSAPGGKVRISGTNLGGSKVFLNGKAVTVVARGSDWMDVKTPKDTQGAARLEVRSPGGSDKSERLSIVGIPTVKRVWPKVASPGSEVELLGAGFQADDEIFVNNHKAHVVQVRKNRLRFRVPADSPGTKSADISVRRGNQSGTVGKIGIPKKLTITDLSIRKASPGETFVVYGSALSQQAKVYFGKYRLKVEDVSEDGTEIAVHIPAGLRGVNWIVVKDGSVSKRSPYQIQILAQAKNTEIQ